MYYGNGMFYPNPMCYYNGCSNGNDGLGGSSWGWGIIIVLFIIFFLFWGGNGNRGNACPGGCR